MERTLDMNKDLLLDKIEYRCKNSLDELFCKRIPYKIRERYEKEIKYLEQSEYFDEFEKVFNERPINKGMIYSKGTISGSLLYFLMTEQGHNPLSTYYYCTKCGYYEFVDKYQNCVDAPDISCPKCRSTIKAEGYSLPIESVWGLDGKKAIGYEKEMAIHPIVEKRLHQLVKEFEPQSFEDKIKLCSCAANTYAWEKSGDVELDLDRFKSFIYSKEFNTCTFYTREELYKNLCSKGMNPTQAYEVSEFVRKGGVVRSNELHKYEIPEEIVLLAQNICYLESRAHAIQTAYRYWIRDNY